MTGDELLDLVEAVSNAIIIIGAGAAAFVGVAWVMWP